METNGYNEMVQLLTDRINGLEEENRGLVRDELVTKAACSKVVEAFGREHTMLAAIEVMSELSAALTKTIRGRHDFEAIDRKIADVEILAECLKAVFVNSGRVKECRMRKVKALMEGIADGTATTLGGDYAEGQ